MGLKDTDFGAGETAQCLKHEDLDLHNSGHVSLIQPAGEVRDAVTLSIGGSEEPEST